MQAISTKTAPAAIGPYSQAVRAGGLVFLSGQIPLDPATGQMVSGDIAEQTGKSILTIRTHVKRAYGKIGVKTRGQLFAKLLPYLSIR